MLACTLHTMSLTRPQGPQLASATLTYRDSQFSRHLNVPHSTPHRVLAAVMLLRLLTLRLLLVAAVFASTTVSSSSAFSLTAYSDKQCQSRLSLYSVTLPSLTAYANTTAPVCYNSSSPTSSAVQSVQYGCTPSDMLVYLFTQLACQYQFVQVGNNTIVNGLLLAIESPRGVTVAEGVCSQVSVTLPNSTDTVVWGVYKCASSAGHRLVPALSIALLAYVVACVASW